jgi:hypothetical protein
VLINGNCDFSLLYNWYEALFLRWLCFENCLGTMSGNYPCENLKNLLVALHVLCYQRDSIQSHPCGFQLSFFTNVSFCWGVFVWFSNYNLCLLLLVFLICFKLPQFLFCLHVCEYFSVTCDICNLPFYDVLNWIIIVL